MKPILLKILLVPLLFAISIQAGTITGTMRAEGKPGTDGGAADGGAYDSHKFKFVERVDYADMHDFVVYIDGPVGNKPVAPEVTGHRGVASRGPKGGRFLSARIADRGRHHGGMAKQRRYLSQRIFHVRCQAL